VVKPRWYVDADTLGLAHVLIRARPDVTYPGDDGIRHRPAWCMPPCVVSDPATRDDVWIPLAASAGMAIITRDKHIATRTAEKAEVLAASARMFAITTPGNLRTWDLLAVVVAQWEKLESAALEPGPYIYSVTRSAMSKIDRADREGTSDLRVLGPARPTPRLRHRTVLSAGQRCVPPPCAYVLCLASAASMAC